jgi:hypothetical protein
VCVCVCMRLRVEKRESVCVKNVPSHTHAQVFSWLMQLKCVQCVLGDLSSILKSEGSFETLSQYAAEVSPGKRDQVEEILKGLPGNAVFDTADGGMDRLAYSRHRQVCVCVCVCVWVGERERERERERGNIHTHTHTHTRERVDKKA